MHCIVLYCIVWRVVVSITRRTVLNIQRRNSVRFKEEYMFVHKDLITA